MKPLTRKIIIIFLILLIPFALIIRHSLSIATAEKPTSSTLDLEKIERFFERGDKVEKLLTSRDEIEAFLSKRVFLSLKLDAHLLWSLGKVSESVSLFQEQLARYNKTINDPHSTKEDIKQALEQTAWININLGNFEEAIELCQKGLERFPQDSTFLSIIAEVYYLRAAAYQGDRQYDLAIENLQKILALENLPPNLYAFTKSCLAHLYLKEGKDDIALDYFQRIIQDHPTLNDWQGSAHYDLANYYIRKKDYPKAKEELKTIIIKHPYSNSAMPAKDRLRGLE